MNAVILGLETGGEHLSVALLSVASDGTFALVDEVTCHRGHKHADSVLTLVAEVLRRQALTVTDLALVAVARGPGSFTGIRVGLSAALGLSLGSGVTVWPVCSLLAMACHVTRGLALPMIDAKRGEVYAGLFAITPGRLPEVVLAPRVGTCDSALAAVASRRDDIRASGSPHDDDILIFGSGALTYSVASQVGPAFHVGAARHVAWLAARQWLAHDRDARAAPPIDAAYLRRSEAEIAADLRDQGSAGTG